MWKCLGLLLLIGQSIIVTAQPEEVSRHSRDVEKCCPCPEAKSDPEPAPSEVFHVVDDCPCKSRSADSETASSLFSPFSRQFHHKPEAKTVLEPEVELASSVLETLKEATEEEYQEALARDAARSANVEQPQDELITILVEPESQERDALPEPSNNYESSYHPVSEISDLHEPKAALTHTLPGARDLMQRTRDVFDGTNSFLRGLTKAHTFPPQLFTRTPEYNILRTPTYENDLFVSPTQHTNGYVNSDSDLIRLWLPIRTQSFLTRKPIPDENKIKLHSKEAFETAGELKDFTHDSHFAPIYHDEGHITGNAMSYKESSNDCYKESTAKDAENVIKTDILNNFPTSQKSNFLNNLRDENGQNEKQLISTKSTNNYNEMEDHETVSKPKISTENLSGLSTETLRRISDMIDLNKKESVFSVESDKSEENYANGKYVSDVHHQNVMPHLSTEQNIQDTIRSATNINNEHDEKLGHVEGRSLGHIITCTAHEYNRQANENEMNTAASAPIKSRSRPQGNGYAKYVSDKSTEDINLDVFEYQPPLLEQSGSSKLYKTLPRLNMKSYKTSLPLPKHSEFQPVKLSKAVRRGNDILGAILTINPHNEKSNIKNRYTQGRNDFLKNPLDKIPSIDDIRSFLEQNAKNVFKVRTPDKYVSRITSNLGNAADELRTYTENTLQNVQESLENRVRNVLDRDRTLLGDVFLNPSGLAESLSRNRYDMTEKLQSLQTDLTDTMHNIHRNVFDQHRSPSQFIPNYNSRNNINSKTIQSHVNPYLKDSKLKNSKLVAPKVPERTHIVIHRPTSRLPANTQNDRIIYDTRAKDNTLNSRFNNKPTTNILTKAIGVSDNSRHSSKLEPKKPLSIKERFTIPKDSRSSNLTPKRPSVLEILHTKKPSLPLFEKSIPSKNYSPERHLLRSSLPAREQKTLPSEIVYNKVPARLQSVPKESTKTEVIHNADSRPMPRLQNSQMEKSVTPTISDNQFLSKLKEAISRKEKIGNEKLNDNKTDVIASASEVSATDPLKENVSYNCKMVCNKT